MSRIHKFQVRVATSNGSKSLIAEGHTKNVKGLRLSAAIWPILISLSVLIFLFVKRFDPNLLTDVTLDGQFFFFIIAALVFLILRVLAYSWRLYILTKGHFNFLKSIQLMLIWHFSSAITPTSVGGAAVAFVVLSQEKLGAAKTAAVVLYTIVVDALFFIISALFFVSIFGNQLFGTAAAKSWQAGFIGAFVIMFLYGSFFFYGAFVKPKRVQGLLLGLSKMKWLSRFSDRLRQTGDQFPLASKELRSKSIGFHLHIFSITILAWGCRFLLLLMLIMAFDVLKDLQMSFAKAFAQIQSLYMIMAFSPTPGGSGFAEILFTDFMGVEIPASLGLLIASIWRFLSNYIFIIIGIIIIPIWLKNVWKERRMKNGLTK